MEESALIRRDARGRFVKGFSGNPLGKYVRRRPFTEALEKLLTNQPELAEAVAKTLIRMALDKNLEAIRELFDRLDGKVVQLTAELSAEKLNEYVHIYRPERDEPVVPLPAAGESPPVES